MNYACSVRIAALVACGCSATNPYYLDPSTASDGSGSMGSTSSGGETTVEPTGETTTGETTVDMTTIEPTTEPTTGETSGQPSTGGVSSDSDSIGGSSTSDGAYCGNGVVEDDEECDNEDEYICTDFCANAPLGPFPVVDAFTEPVGIPDGPEFPGGCGGALLGVVGILEESPPEITELQTVCADVLFVPEESGVYRLVPNLNTVEFGEPIGGDANAPDPFALECPPQAPFVTGISAHGKAGGIRRLTLQCADIYAEYFDDEYFTVINEISEVSQGVIQGDPYPLQSCFDLFSEVATEMFITATLDRVTSISLECALLYYAE